MVLDDIADLWGVPGRYLGGASVCPGSAGCQNKSRKDGSATGEVLVNPELVRGISKTKRPRDRDIAGSRDRGTAGTRYRGIAGPREPAIAGIAEVFPLQDSA